MSWCHYTAGNVELAIAGFGSIVDSPKLGVNARTDLVLVSAVENVPVKRMIGLVGSKYVDTAMLVMASALYADMNNASAALTLLDMLPDKVDADVSCNVSVNRIALEHKTRGVAEHSVISLLATAGPACRDRAEDLGCAVAVEMGQDKTHQTIERVQRDIIGMCSQRMRREPETQPSVYLAAARAACNHLETRWYKWTVVAELAEKSLSIEGGADILLFSLNRAERLSNCSELAVAEISTIIDRVVSAPLVPGALLSRISDVKARLLQCRR